MSDAAAGRTWADGAGARRLVAALVIVLPLMALVPNLSGWLLSDPPQREYLGFRHLPDDHHQYATFVAQARDGASPFMRDLLTPDEHPGRFLAFYPWLVGRLAALAGLGEAEAWLVLQYPAGVALLACAWIALGALTRTPSQRLTAFLLATLAAGLDWLFFRLHWAGVPGTRQLASHFAVYWNWNLTGTAALPMWSAASAVLLAVVALLVAQLERFAAWRAVLLAPLALLCWALHPYTGLALFALAAAIPFARPLARLARAERPRLRAIASRGPAVVPVLLAAVPAVVETLWASRDPAVAHASLQALRYGMGTSPLYWPVVWTLPFVLGWFGLRATRVEDDARDEVMVAFLATVLVLSLNPAFSGYKFQYLAIVPACALAARGVDRLRASVAWCDAAWRGRVVPWALLAAASIGTFYAPFADIASLPGDAEVHASADELACYEFVRTAGPGVVLAPPERGAIAAWKTRHPVLYGHYFMTIDAERRRAECARVLDPATPPDARMATLAATRVRWVIVPPPARARLAEETWGRVAFESGGWRVVEPGRRVARLPVLGK